MQTTGDRANFPAGTAVSGRSTADSSGINGPFTECNALMRERDALVYHRQMLKRKRTELEQSLQKQRNEKGVCPALFVFPSAEALMMATQPDQVQSTVSTHGIGHRVPNSPRLVLDMPELSEAMVQYISQLETEEQLEYIAIRLRRVTPAIKILCGLLSLRELNLSETCIKDEDVGLLSECHTLVKIFLKSCKTLTNVNPLSSIATLEVINLSFCYALTHIGALGKLPVLKEVDLSGTRITDNDVRLLSECHTLVKIFLKSCKTLTNVNPLSSIATLELIDLSDCNSLTHIGVLGKLPVLKEVNLSGTRITDDDVRLLSECHTLVKIDLHWCKALKNVNPLSSIATLELIDLSDCNSLTCVGALGKLPALKEVNLGCTSITDDDVRLLSECHTLVKIDLSCCKSLKNVNPLSSIATLELIDLSDCNSLTHIGALGKLPALKEVKLSFTRITDEEVRLLSESNSLVKIDLHYCKALTNVNPLSSIATLELIDLSYCTSLARVGALGKLPALKEVKLSFTRITDEEVRLLSESCTLVKIVLRCCKALTNVNPLSSIATLEEINLSSCPSLTHVGELGKLPVLKEVDLSGTPITDEGVNSLTSLRRELGLPSIDIIRDD